MAGAVEVKIVGVEKLVKKLSTNSTMTAVKRTVVEGTAAVNGTAKNLCPVDTGNLRGSIHMSVATDRTQVVGKVSTSTEYAMYVEFGTGTRGKSSLHPMSKELGLAYGDIKGMVAHPYMYPALEQHRKKILNDIGKAVNV